MLSCFSVFIIHRSLTHIRQTGWEWGGGVFCRTEVVLQYWNKGRGTRGELSLTETAGRQRSVPTR